MGVGTAPRAISGLAGGSHCMGDKQVESLKLLPLPPQLGESTENNVSSGKGQK